MAKTPGTGIKIGTHFSPRYKRPIDDRFVFDTVAEMKNFTEAALYDSIVSYNKETNTMYQWFNTNPVDETFGKWKEFTLGGGEGTIDHSKLTNRQKEDQHPISAITDLQDNLDSLQDAIDAIGTGGVSEATVDTKIAEHNLSDQSHNDIRNSVKAVSDSLSIKANLASQENDKIGNIAIVDKDGQYEVSDTKLTDVNDDIDILNQQTGLLTTSINDIKDDYVSKIKDNTIDGKNTLNGDLVIGQKDDVAANIRNGVNDKVVLTTKTLDTNTQATYISGDQVEVYAPDAMVVETAGGLYTKKTPEGSSDPEYYEVIDRGNLSGVLHQQHVAYQNESNFFGQPNRFIRDIILDAHGGDANTGSDIKFKRGNNVDISVLSTAEEPVNGFTAKLYGHTVKVEAGYSVLLNTPEIKTQRTEDGVSNTYTVLDSGNVSEYITGELTAVEKYGIEADYSVHYGIIDCPIGLIDTSISSKTITINPGIVLKLAGGTGFTTLASQETYEVEESGTLTLFLAKTSDTQIGFLEAADVYYQIEEPTNGTTSYLAWFNPERGKWQFKSDATGNVWREAIATPIANIKVNESNTGILAIDYIGYRIINDDIFAQLSDIDAVETKITTINSNIEALQKSVTNQQSEIADISAIVPDTATSENKLVSKEELVGTNIPLSTTDETTIEVKISELEAICDTTISQTSLLENADLNTIIKTGLYVSHTAETTATIVNKPDLVSSAFYLEVIYFDENSSKQILTTTSNIKYIRNYVGTVWTEWEEEDYSSTQVETLPTASEDYKNVVLQYIGETTYNYTNGFFYKCMESQDEDNNKFYTWSNIKVQAGSEGGSSVLEEDVVANVDVGGVSRGQVLIAGTSLTDVIKSLVQKELAPTLTLSVDKPLIVKKGSLLAAPTNITVVSKKESLDVVETSILVNSVKVASGTEAAGETLTYEVTSDITTDTLITGTVTDGKNTSQNSVEIKFINPYYYGIVEDAVNIDVSSLQEQLSVKNNAISEIYTSVANYLVFMYDFNYGPLRSIKDQNNFENLNAWIQTTITYNGATYYCYITNYKITCSNFTYTFYV